MQHRRTRYLCLLALVLIAVLPGSTQGQQSALGGTWSLNREESDDINAKIDIAVARMNIVVRLIARPRLRSTNTAYSQMVITHDERNVRVDVQGSPSVSSAPNGQPVLWQRETGGTCTQMRGDCVRVTTQWENGKLKQAFAAEDGQRVNVFTVNADGKTLTMNVTVTSPRLPAPLTYRLIYNRAT